MKSKQVLVLSLLGNVMLVAFVALVFKIPSPFASPPAMGEAEVTDETSTRVHNGRLSPRARAQAQTSLPQQLNWSQIDSADYKALIANLRAIECPEQTIRDIVTSRLNKSTAAKRAAIRRGGEEFVFWKPDVEYTDYYPKLRQERALEREKSTLLKELFGTDPNEIARREAGTYDYMEWQYDFLTGEKRDKAREIQERYVDLGRELKSAGSSNPEVREKVRGLYDERLVELAKHLTPEEVEIYDLCSSSLSESMRSNLDGFHPTADEFKYLYRIEKAAGDDPEAKKEEEAAIRQLLGEARYAQYQRVQDFSYRELYRLTKARDLPQDTADKVWEIKILTENSKNALLRDSNLTPEERNNHLRQNNEQARQALANLLGENNLNIYQTRGGFWVRQLGR